MSGQPAECRASKDTGIQASGQHICLGAALSHSLFSGKDLLLRGLCPEPSMALFVVPQDSVKHQGHESRLAVRSCPGQGRDREPTLTECP